MIALNPWRLALLFFVSGVACRFLLLKLGRRRFSVDRLRRLLPVILFGMLVIIPPQTYIELYHHGLVTSGYIEFWLNDYLQGADFPGKQLPTWDHLWFLVYLMVYSILLAVALPLIQPDRGDGSRTFSIVLVVIPGLWLCLTNILVSELNPITHAFVDDWAAHLRWGGMFVTGVLCARNPYFWGYVRDQRRLFAVLAFVFLVLELACNAYYQTGRMDAFWDGIIYSALSGIYAWCAILTLSGYSAKYLNSPSRTLSYLNVAILPVYVLHQPILLLTAYVIFPMKLPILVEVIILIASTAFVSLAIYEVSVRRWDLPRFLFGLKRLSAAGISSDPPYVKQSSSL